MTDRNRKVQRHTLQTDTETERKNGRKKHRQRKKDTETLKTERDTHRDKELMTD